MTLVNNSIALKSVKELHDFKFFIPGYQRGYRWTKKLVEELLDDLFEFFESKLKISDSYYCLQPLVVKQKVASYEKLLEKIHRENSIEKIESLIKEAKKGVPYEVIDGQQRLTTIFIILKVLGEKNLFSIEYETRQQSSKYLNDLSETNSELNIDTYFMWEAKKTIQSWLESKEHDLSTEKFNREKFCENIKQCVQFIWYEPNEENSIDVFTRLNLGKISLTNSELIKALFLNRSNFSNRSDVDVILRQREIASEWDRIELTLHNEEFWYFLNAKEPKGNDTRIDFLFELIYQSDPEAVQNNQHSTDQYATFRFFYSKFNQKKSVNPLQYWANFVKPCFLMLCEWYNDLELFHYIGLWLTINNNELSFLKQLWDSDGDIRGNKQFFKEKIKKMLYDKLSKIRKQDSTDPNARKEMQTIFRPVLLFHNIQTVINQNKQQNKNSRYPIDSMIRFSFYLYKTENWDVEHINSLTDNAEADLKTQREWLNNVYWFAKPDVKQLIDEFNKRYPGNNGDDQSTSEFEKIKSILSVKSNDDWDEYEKNSLKNYVLLNASINRSYKNEIFTIKRQIILDKDFGDQKGPSRGEVDFSSKKDFRSEGSSKFVPPCTKLAFMKYFSNKPDTADDVNYWTKDDADAYLKDIDKCLQEINPGNSAEQ